MGNEDVVRAYVEAFNGADWPAMEALFTTDAMISGVLGWGNLEVALPIWRELHASMNMRMAVDALVSSGDTVVARLTETGQFTGPFRGLPGKEPTGKTYQIQPIEWFELDGGRIKRRYAARDSGTITRQVLG